jgi:hypothetical protein
MLNRTNAGALINGAPANEATFQVRLLVRKAIKGYEEMQDAGEIVSVTKADALWLVRRKYAEWVN